MKALVTGASSGIGRALVIQLAEDGYDIIAVARRRDRLEELKSIVKTELTFIPADLSDRRQCFSLYEQVSGQDISIAINNAGFGVFGEFDKTDLDGELSMLDVNVESLHILTKLFLKDFLKKDYGYILNVASSAAFFPGPLFASYYASKAYVLRLTQGIYEELRRKKSNVYIGALCPGPVDTEFNATAHAGGFSAKPLSASDVASYTLKKMYAKKTLIIPGGLMKAAHALGRLLPDGVQARLVYGFQNKKAD